MLSDVVESAGLPGFAEIGLVLFVIAFVLVVVRVVLVGSDDASRYAEIPLDDQSPTESTGDK